MVISYTSFATGNTTEAHPAHQCMEGGIIYSCICMTAIGQKKPKEKTDTDVD